MNINSLGNYVNGKTITLLSKNNPFKKGTLQYYLLSFIIEHHDSLSEYRNNENNRRLLKFLALKKETFFIDPWNGNQLFDAAISLSMIHNIIKMSKPFTTPSFGIFAEDGLFNLIQEPKFIDHLKKSPETENIKLLWLSLYMNQKIKKNNHVPQIKFDKPNFSYSENSFTISFSNLAYHKIFDSVLEIPLAAFPDTWHSEDWIALNSRGLFHHIGDHVGVFYGAKSVGECYFLGKDQSNHLVTLSTPCASPDIENSSSVNFSYHKLFSHVHPTDFVYVYGVPKGNPALFDNPMFTSSEEEDCQQNNTKNVVAAENFWNNPVFMRNTKRKMFVGSIEDKLKDILLNIQDLLSEEQYVIAQKIINNEPVWKEELIGNNLTAATFPTDKWEELKRRSAFFMKSLAHKTVCEIINPVENLELGFFMKHNGSAPQVKTLFIFDLLFSSFTGKQKKITKPLFHMKQKFIKSFLTQEQDFVNVWSGDDKKGYLFSDIVSMRNEYRMFVINNRVVATTACFRNTVPLNSWQNGRFDPRLVNGHNDQATHMNRERVAKYAKFARQYCREMQAENPQCHSYVLDVAWCDELSTVVPIEINSITWSGAYQANMHRVCSATLKKPFHYSNLKLFLGDKCTTWLSLIENNLITNSMFELCGLDRTLKADTLPFLSTMINNTLESVKNYSSNINDPNNIDGDDSTQDFNFVNLKNSSKPESRMNIINELDKIYSTEDHIFEEDEDEDEDEDNNPSMDEESKEK